MTTTAMGWKLEFAAGSERAQAAVSWWLVPMLVPVSLMPYELELCFDVETEAAVRAAWERLARVSGSDFMLGPRMRPHIALAVFEADDADALSGWQELLARARGPLAHVVPAGIGTFQLARGVCYLALRREGFLSYAHGRCLSFLAERGLHVTERYQSRAWVPHCTLAHDFDLAKVEEVERAARREGFDCPWRVTTCALVYFPPTQIVGEAAIGRGAAHRLVPHSAVRSTSATAAMH